MEAVQINYQASPTCLKFHESDALVKLLIGPFGSGKSVACTMDQLFMAVGNHHQAAPLCRDGKRYMRSAIVRNSYRELQDTTLKTFMEWMPPGLGTFKQSTMTYRIKHPQFVAEFLFRALDKPQDIGRLLSLELTSGWLNEAREIPKAVFDAIQGRLGRYPKKSFLKEEYDPVLIADTNPPDDLHWIYRIFEEMRPKGHQVFHQPGGMEHNAENLENLMGGIEYYRRLARGKDQAWIDVYINGNYGFLQDGKPVFPMFNDAVHVSDTVIKYEPHQPVWFGCDYGLTPAAVFIQKGPTGQYRVIDEIITEDLGAVKFAEMVSKKLRKDYGSSQAEGWGDPAGDQRSKIREAETPNLIMQAEAIPISSAPTNDPVMRTEAVGKLLGAMDMSGEPSLFISPVCKMLRRGMAGGYKYRQLQVGGDERYVEKPDKNIYSHVCEALEYAMLGLGEGYNLIDIPVSQRQRIRVKRQVGGYC